MKYILLILYVITAGTAVSAQKQNKVSSGLYALPEEVAEHTFFTGSTKHFSTAKFRLESLSESEGSISLRSDMEQIIILKEGQALVSTSQERITIGPNSVMFLLPGEVGTIEAESPTVRYYRMNYKTFHPTQPEEIPQDINSFIINYDSLTFHESQKGGVRRYFNTTTAMCPYYEMHVTTLNPGLQSHPPHTHEAAEIILVIDGETEQEIDGQPYQGRKGDVYFAGSNVPHAIRNVGDTPCQYFAFQWGVK